MVIGKSDIWPYEYIIFYSYAIPKIDAAFDSDAISYNNIVFNKNMITNIAVRSNDCSEEDMNKCPNTRILSNCYGFDN